MAVWLAATEYGDGEPVAILHGLFGAGRNWTRIAQRLAATHRIVVFDLRNHGASAWADTMSYGEMAEDVRKAMAARGHRRYGLIGHSMGGKVAMTAALEAGAAVDRLLVVDTAPVVYSITHGPYIAAMRGLDLTTIARRRDADARLAPAIPDPTERNFLLQSLVFDADGPRWQLNLAALDAAMPAIAGFPELPAATTYQGPTLFIAGGKSGYLRPEHEMAVLARFPNARLVRIADAGHWLHVERTDAFLELTEAFLGGESFGAPTCNAD